MARAAADSVSTDGSMGFTKDEWFLVNGSSKKYLSSSVDSNYEYRTPSNGDAKYNKALLKAAPVGTVLENHYTESWVGSEYNEYTLRWVKAVDGAWHPVTHK